MSRFVLSCDSNGQFLDFKEIPLELTFKEDEKTSKPLRVCLENYKDQNMIFFCKEVCGNFKYMQLNDYFFPQINKIKSYTYFLKKNLNKMLGESQDNR